MLVRLESIKNSEQVLVIDEIGRFLGEIDSVEFFLSCVLDGEDILEEDDYIYYVVDKECLKIAKKDDK